MQRKPTGTGPASLQAQKPNAKSVSENMTQNAYDSYDSKETILPCLLICSCLADLNLLSGRQSPCLLAVDCPTEVVAFLTRYVTVGFFFACQAQPP